MIRIEYIRRTQENQKKKYQFQIDEKHAAVFESFQFQINQRMGLVLVSIATDLIQFYLSMYTLIAYGEFGFILINAFRYKLNFAFSQ